MCLPSQMSVLIPDPLSTPEAVFSVSDAKEADPPVCSQRDLSSNPMAVQTELTPVTEVPFDQSGLSIMEKYQFIF